MENPFPVDLLIQLTQKYDNEVTEYVKVHILDENIADVIMSNRYTDEAVYLIDILYVALHGKYIPHGDLMGLYIEFCRIFGNRGKIPALEAYGTPETYNPSTTWDHAAILVNTSPSVVFSFIVKWLFILLALSIVAIWILEKFGIL
jgi:hypothetical protein